MIQAQLQVKGALVKYNIYLFRSNSIENFKFKPIPTFSADYANVFSFCEVSCEHTASATVSHRQLYCVFIEVNLENRKCYRYIHISSKVINLECKTQHAVITHSNIPNDIKIPTFSRKSGWCWTCPMPL